MLQYILNLSAIWLLSLIVFDVFLRKDTYHSYNRLYLLLTLTMGICLPLYSLQSDAIVYSSIGKPMVENVAVIKQNVVESETAQTVFDWQQYLLIAYLIGVAAGLLLLLKDLMLIIKLYNKGDKTKDCVWTIIETGKEHTPFSAFRYVFISSKESYSADELRMILSHEEQHGHLLHFVDLLFIQLAKIVFWFHPLIYIYYNRLITVHEYQADAAVDKTPSAYGQFLIEQALLRSAPALTHSFNRSPIKKRILMLTRKTSAIAKSKTLVIAPLVLICAVMFTQNAFSIQKKKKGDLVYCNGNTFKLWAPKPDTSTVYEAVTGKEALRITSMDSFPKTMNSKPILKEASIKPIYIGPDKSLKDYVFNSMKQYIEKLSDDKHYKFYINNVVIDEKGKIVFITDIEFKNSYTAFKFTEAQQKMVNQMVAETEKLLLGKTLFSPAEHKGEKVIYLLNPVFQWNEKIAVENQKAYIYTPADR